jgi:hypothetical protein
MNYTCPLVLILSFTFEGHSGRTENLRPDLTYRTTWKIFKNSETQGFGTRAYML